MNAFLDKTAGLTPATRRIICHKATEYPHTGVYNTVMAQGSYLCRRCGLALFRANSQFSSGCGWPSFDMSIDRAIKEIPDVDGRRIEILCTRCDGHLGHVFIGEGMTEKNRRYCVNSASVDFVENNTVLDTEEAIVAGGCFWGVDYFLRQLPGVLAIEAGYTGGVITDPSYQQVCEGRTGHYEAIRVIYDVDKTDYRAVLQRFFEIHDPTQQNGQGPDVGPQYKSAVFFYNQEQYAQANVLIQQLRNNGYDVVTRLLEAQPFWPAENYHQNYYSKQQKLPYCHRRVTRFKD